MTGALDRGMEGTGRGMTGALDRGMEGTGAV